MRESTEAERIAIGYFWDTPENDFDYVDNIRVATIGNTDEESVYNEAVANGCCGFHDTILTDANGVEFKFGFNYGH